MAEIKISKKQIKIILLIAIIFIGFFLRFEFATQHVSSIFSPDEINYDKMARQFLDKGFLGYLSDKPNAAVTPGYPLFLSSVYKTFGYKEGSPFTAVRIIQALFGTASIFLIYLIGAKTINARVGLFSAALYAIYPPFNQSVSFILTEVLYTFFFLLYFWFQIKALESDGIWINIGAGLIFGTAVLIRPALFPLFIVPFVYDWVIKRDKKVIKNFAYTLTAVVLIMIPWWIRNYIVLGNVVLLSSGSANPLYAGAFPYMKGLKYIPDEKQFRAAVDTIVNGFLTQPLLYLRWFTVGKLTVIFQKPWFDNAFLRPLLFLHYAILSLGSIGAIYSTLEKRLRYITVYILLLISMQLMFVPDPRYAYTIMPFIIVLTAFVIDYLFIESRKNCSKKEA